MNAKPLFALLLFFTPMSLLAQNNLAYSALLIPDELKENAHEVIRTEVMEFTILSEKSGEVYFHTAITVLDNKSSANHVAIYYDADSKIDKIEASIYDGTGRLVRKIKKNEIRDFAAVDGFSIYQDDRVKYLELSYHTLPFTIEYEYRKKLEGGHFFDYPDWRVQQYNTAVEKSSFMVRLPTDMKFHYETLNLDIEPKIGGDGKNSNYTCYTWQVSNLPALDEEDYGPTSSEILPLVNISPDAFQFDRYKGSMANWKDFGAFLYELYEGKNNLPEEMVAKVHELTDGVEEPKEKINILYKYLQENMRYVSVQLGIGGFQPFDAEYVYRNKYGDCKALSNFMKSILEEAGIEAYPVIIYSGNPYYKVKEEFTTSKFNHVIVYVPSEDYWLECTSSNYPPNFIGYGNSDRNVLLVTPEGGKLVRTPKLDAEANLEENIATVTLLSDGSATINGRGTFTGADHEMYRYIESSKSGNDLEEWFTENSSIPSFHIESLAIKSEPMEPKSNLDYSVGVRRYCSKAGKRFFVPLNTINPYNHLPSKLNERHFPIVLNRGYVERDSFTFKIPDGYEIESMPDPEVELKSDFATYSVKLEKQEEGLKYTRTFQVQPTRLPAEEYDKFREFFLEVSKMDNMKMVLVEKRT